jgi:hypothetical protein
LSNLAPYQSAQLSESLSQSSNLNSVKS